MVGPTLHVLPADLATDEGFLERFRDAVSLWGGPHPRMLRLHGVEETAEGLVLLAAPAPALTLRDVVEAAGDVPQSERTSWAVARVLDLVSALVTVGAPHGDMTIRSVGIDTEGWAVLLPPVARLIAGLQAHRARSWMGAGAVRGDVRAMPPEALRAETIDGRSDVYQLGHLLYRLLGGPPLFAGRKDVEVLHAIMAREMPPGLRTAGVVVPSTLDDVVARAMAYTRDERFESAEELGAALAPFGAEASKTRQAITTAALLRSEARTTKEIVTSMFDGPIELRRPCPKRWDQLSGTGDAEVRDCAQCGLSVRRVSTLAALVPLSGRCVFYDPT